jgi:nitroreductase
MKHLRIMLSFMVLLLISGKALQGQESASCVTDLILSSYSSKAFNSVPVSKDQIELVLRSGIKAPSARNSQAWKFTVVKDNSLAKEIIRDALPGNVVIVISGPEADSPGMNADIDCALAMAYMYISAQSLGLASHLYTGPIRGVNENLKEKLEIPKGYRAIIAMKIGNMDDSVDGISSASSRNHMEDVVTYK